MLANENFDALFFSFFILYIYILILVKFFEEGISS